MKIVVRIMKTRMLRITPAFEMVGGAKVPFAACVLGAVTPSIPRIRLMAITIWMMRKNLELIFGFCMEALIHSTLRYRVNIMQFRTVELQYHKLTALVQVRLQPGQHSQGRQ